MDRCPRQCLVAKKLKSDDLHLHIHSWGEVYIDFSYLAGDQPAIEESIEITRTVTTFLLNFKLSPMLSLAICSVGRLFLSPGTTNMQPVMRDSTCVDIPDGRT